MKENFLKNKVITVKTPFFVIGPFCTHHSVCLNICFWCCCFVWRWCVFNIVLSTKKQYSIFWGRFSFSRKSVSKKNYWNCSKFPLIATLKHADFSNGGLFWKSLVPFFRRTSGLFVGFKLEPLKNRFPKFSNTHFAGKLVERSNQSFLLFHKSHFWNICTVYTCNRMYRT